ncbi:cob(I)yrinic acid a,c-diamide adenosyltransferase [Parasporobacterium paucivorans]|uniref:Cob(I)alamin adenosyltransferase n=1 Tax=Parasporobacterium paucivorans DSM 15970 TaxID=1122934 RepID=A0A1M6FNF0_9FIRM|nr:cob(I)yrinic acid a,c-diamide adenosyltransferase [Parasporobacterium paucivorans]SHI99204.1 cob(I)alamin adenosyltransferase [Parasporobacterium paucivorans DSM 15970]
MNKGLIHIYCGNGKGKTTASIGLCVRAAGSGLRVLVARFLKNNKSGELSILNQIPNVFIMPFDKDYGFTFKMSEETKKEAKIAYTNLLIDSFEKANTEEYDLLIMDEIIATNNHGFVDDELLLGLLRNRHPGLEVVMTGRNPSDALIELADYVSEIKKIKHPFDMGIPARKGIEI